MAFPQLEQHQSEAFQLCTMNRSLQQRVQALGEEASLEEITCFPLSLQNELQQSQVAWSKKNKMQTEQFNTPNSWSRSFLHLIVVRRGKKCTLLQRNLKTLNLNVTKH